MLSADKRSVLSGYQRAEITSTRSLAAKRFEKCKKPLSVLSRASAAQKQRVKSEGIKLRPVASAKADNTAKQNNWFFTEKGQRQWVCHASIY